MNPLTSLVKPCRSAGVFVLDRSNYYSLLIQIQAQHCLFFRSRRDSSASHPALSYDRIHRVVIPALALICGCCHSRSGLGKIKREYYMCDQTPEERASVSRTNFTLNALRLAVDLLRSSLLSSDFFPGKTRRNCSCSFAYSSLKTVVIHLLCSESSEVLQLF